MITVIATLRVNPDKLRAFEEDFRAWADVVKANEPGTIQYSLAHDSGNPGTYFVIELYADKASFEAHSQNLQARPDAPKDLFIAPPIIQVLDTVRP